jgi:hypothetical protein
MPYLTTSSQNILIIKIKMFNGRQISNKILTGGAKKKLSQDKNVLQYFGSSKGSPKQIHCQTW